MACTDEEMLGSLPPNLMKYLLWHLRSEAVPSEVHELENNSKWQSRVVQWVND